MTVRPITFYVMAERHGGKLWFPLWRVKEEGDSESISFHEMTSDNRGGTSVPPIEGKRGDSEDDLP